MAVTELDEVAGNSRAAFADIADCLGKRGAAWIDEVSPARSTAKVDVSPKEIPNGGFGWRAIITTVVRRKLRTAGDPELCDLAALREIHFTPGRKDAKAQRTDTIMNPDDRRSLDSLD